MILIALVVIVVILNVTFIVYDLASFIRLLFVRYGMKVKQNLRLLKKVSDKKPTNNDSVKKKTKEAKVSSDKPCQLMQVMPE